MLSLAVGRSSTHSLARAALTRLWVVALVLLASLSAQAAPEAKRLRVDPRASLDSGHTIVTTVDDIQATAARIDAAIAGRSDLAGQLLRVYLPNPPQVP